MKPRFYAFLFIIIIAPITALPQMSIAENGKSGNKFDRITIESADYFKHERETGLTTLKGNVTFRYGDYFVSCNEAVIDEKRKTAIAKHDVQLSGPDGDFTGDMLFYEYDYERFEIANGTGSTTAEDIQGHLYFSANIIKGSHRKIKLYKGRFTTCEKECTVEYHMRASDVTIYPEKKLIARHVYAHFGGTRAFYYPVYLLSLKEKRRYMPEFGYNKTEGFYIYSDYGYLAKENLDGWILLHYMTKKGVKFGADDQLHPRRLEALVQEF